MITLFLFFMSEEEIKLIWDLRSIDAKEIAEHHVKHVTEYIESKELKKTTVFCEEIFAHYYIVCVLTTKNNMIQIRDELKPNRGEYV